MVVACDLEEGRDLDDRKSASEEDWNLFFRTQQTGTKVASADLDAATKGKNVVIAVVVYMKHERDQRAEEILRSTPPPFMIAQITNGDSICVR